jgi:[ribosomal protein S5]-alanine N-acetyltransferase
MRSERLQYRPIDAASLDAFHSLVTDEHVRRYLLDGSIVSREWSEERMRASESLFTRRGVGIWIAHTTSSDELVGFCGFLELPTLHSEPQLVYALFERFTGQGLATEMAMAAITEARTKPGFDEIIAGVDDVNSASAGVLEKLGFRQISVHPGAFDTTSLMRLARGVSARRSLNELPTQP